MKLLRFGEPGLERPGVIGNGSDTVLDATPVTADYDVAFFHGDGIVRLRRAVETGDLPPVDITGARLGAPLCWNVLGIRSAERIDAEQNYVAAVIPSLVELLPDHAAYLELRSKDIEQQFEEVLSDANLKRAIHAAIETVVPTWNDELAACALSLTDAQVAGLSESEREVRRRLLPVPKVDEQA